VSSKGRVKGRSGEAEKRRRAMGNGSKWRMANSEWRVVNGEWRMVSSEWRMVFLEGRVPALPKNFRLNNF
jgi:hypothetical protein